MPTVKEPYFSLIASGIKTAEGRLAEAKYLALRPGDVIEFTSEINGQSVYNTKTVSRVEVFASFDEMLRAVGLTAMLGDTVSSVEEGVAVYRSFGRYRELETSMGVCAIHFA